ncbi:MAG TPA: hypothetical protein VLL76_04530, partial [Candidatus Omnitrophota bacterium]|nr:hypothetical protein [Candidatus Omnitrophota bacterium]
MDHSEIDVRMDRPFPLQRIFRRRIVPAILLILALMAGLGGLAETRIAREVYLNIARSRAEVIAGAVAAEAPEAWRLLLDAPLTLLHDPAATAALQAAFAEVLSDARIAKVKVYEPSGRLILGGAADKLGKLEAAPQLRDAITTGEAIALRTSDADAPVYEFYVPIVDHDGAVRLAFEIYEPAGFLDRILLLNALPAIALPAVLMTLLLAWLVGIVGRAQKEIDLRTAALSDMRQRLERLVS